MVQCRGTRRWGTVVGVCLVPEGGVSVCCFVLLIPTPEEYRVPRVNPGVTASKLFPPLLPSLATPGCNVARWRPVTRDGP